MKPRPDAQDPGVLVRAYVAALPRSLAPRTRKAYERNVMGLVGYLRPQRPDLRLVTTQDLNAYILWLLASNTPSTANVHRCAVRHFFSWLAAEGHVDEDVASRTHPVIGVNAARPRLQLEPSHIEVLDTATWKWSTTPERDRAIVHLFLHAGVHVDEAQALTWDEVDLGSRMIHVAHRERSGPVPIDDVLHASLRALRPAERVHAHVFLNSRGGPMNTRMLNKIVHDTLRELGLPDGSPSTLRRAFTERAASKSLDRATRNSGYQDRNKLRRAVGELGAVVEACAARCGGPNLGPVTTRCRHCGGTGAQVRPAPEYTTVEENVTARLRALSIEVRRTATVLADFTPVVPEVPAQLEAACVGLLQLAHEIENADGAAEIPYADIPDAPKITTMSKRLRTLGTEARLYSAYFKDHGWYNASTREWLRIYGVNLALLALAAEARTTVQMWPMPLRKPLT